MTEHTPGPWHVVPDSLGTVDAANGITVAQAQATKHARTAEDHLERAANARLIASAPDLLSALIEVQKLDFIRRMPIGKVIANAIGKALA